MLSYKIFLTLFITYKLNDIITLSLLPFIPNPCQLISISKSDTLLPDICLYWQLNGIWGISGTTKGMAINFYQMLVSIRRHKIKKNVDTTGQVCKLQTKVPKNQSIKNAISWHTNFTNLCRIATNDIKNEPWKFQINISKIGHFNKTICKMLKKLVCTIQNGP